MALVDLELLVFRSIIGNSGVQDGQWTSFIVQEGPVVLARLVVNGMGRMIANELPLLYCFCHPFLFLYIY